MVSRFLRSLETAMRSSLVELTMSFAASALSNVSGENGGGSEALISLMRICVRVRRWELAAESATASR